MIFIRLDENVSHKIGEFAEGVGIPHDVVIDTPEKLRQRGLADVDWMTAHSQRGGRRDVRIAFSGDTFTDRERAVAETLGISLFYTPFMYWRPLRRMGQAAYFLRWLPTIIEIAKANPPGSQFRLPGHFNPRANLRPLRSITGRMTVRPGRPRKPRKVAPAPLLDKA